MIYQLKKQTRLIVQYLQIYQLKNAKIYYKFKPLKLINILY